MTPQVSVIIPAYNTAQYIRQAIYSALKQTGFELEVIVVDDASTDSTTVVVESIPDNRVRLIKNERNIGPSGSRNRAIEVARGDWIAILDSDDWYAPGRLERLLRVASERGVEMVADDIYQIFDGAALPHCTQLQLGGCQKKDVFEVDTVAFLESNVPGIRCLRLGQLQPLILRSFLKRYGLKYDERVNYTEDYLFYLSCLLRGARCIVVPEPYYYRRLRAGSLSGGDRITHLEQSREITEQLLQHEKIVNTASLNRILMKRLSAIQKCIVVERVMKHVRNKALIYAIKDMLSHPKFFLFFLRRFYYVLYVRYILLTRKVNPFKHF